MRGLVNGLVAILRLENVWLSLIIVTSSRSEGRHSLPTLNENLEWSQIIAKRPQDGLAFRRAPEKVLLPKDEMLCRFITTESKRKGIPGNHVFFSPWWTKWRATVAMLSRFKSVVPKDVVRARLAVTQEFSRELDSLVQIILIEPVYAWKGITQHQNDDATGVTYIGGEAQLYVPNLASDAEGLSSRVAYIHSFTSIESLC